MALAFIQERDRIAMALGPLALRIEHHRSTSVVGLAAKPVIDIQVSVATLHPLDRYITPLAVLGYVHVPHQDDAVCTYFINRKRGHTHIMCISWWLAETTNSRRLHFGISFVITRR
jgi:GrpB-like predicted nucleotidyltransferase (UPF0157 family)